MVDTGHLLNDVKGDTKGELVHQDIEAIVVLVAFQADDEGSIPFTRSNVFKCLRSNRPAIPTSGLLLIPTNVPLPFASPGVSWRQRRLASWSAWRSAVGLWRTCAGLVP
jgi:hypothetical protein